jgi:hypothetical protein
MISRRALDWQKQQDIARLAREPDRCDSPGLAFVVEWAAELIVRASTYYDIDEARPAAERLAESRG